MADRSEREQREEHEEAELLAPALVHELRQPLTGVRAGLELISRKLGEQVTSLGEWKMIGEQLDRIDELFRAYRDFLHPERSSAVPFEARAVVDRAAVLLNHRLRRLGPRFSVQAPPEPLPYAWGYPNALLHALTNVLSNAADAVESKGAESRIEVRLTSDPGPPGFVQVRVSDDGVGVPAEVQSRLFELRYTTKQGGSGLGLPIARRMMTSFGGEVRLVPEREPGRAPWAATEFCIDVPSRTAEEISELLKRP